MKKILRRLRSRAGETLVESMAAILIFTMGSIIMLSMVSTAADINQAAKKADESYYAQIIVAEMTSGTPIEGNVIIGINGVNDDGSTKVNVFRNAAETDALYTFYVKGGSGS